MANVIQCVSLPPPSHPPPEATSQTNPRKKTVDLTGTPVFPHAQWCISYMLCTTERINAMVVCTRRELRCAFPVWLLGIERGESAIERRRAGLLRRDSACASTRRHSWH